MSRTRKLVIVSLLPLLIVVLGGCGFVQSVQLMSVDSVGDQGAGISDVPFVSADGSAVAFQSTAADLAASDTNGVTDIFVRQIASGSTVRASLADGGGEANGESTFPSVSGDGQRVAFLSAADNLVTPDAGGRIDAFVHDLSSSETTMVSIATDGTQANRRSNAPVISTDGTVVVFQSAASNLGADANLTGDVFARDLTAGTTSLVSVATDGSFGDANSSAAFPNADGTVVAFVSLADNLVAGDTNGVQDIFVRDMSTGETTLVSRASAGTIGDGLSANPMVSADGRYVVFASESTNLVTDDTNGVRDIFVHDRTTGETVRASLTSAGAQLTAASFNPAISPDGQFVAFNTTSAVDEYDTNGRQDIYVHNRVNGQAYRVSKSADNYPAPPLVEGNGNSSIPSMSSYATLVAFESMATNLVTAGTPDTNGGSDVLAASVSWDSLAPTTTHDAPADWSNGDVTVTLSATDNRLPVEGPFPTAPWGGVSYLTYIVDGTTYTDGSSVSPPMPPDVTPVVDYPGPASVTFSTEGVHTLEFFAVDNAENREDTQTVTVSIDLTDPTVSGNVLPSYTTSATITLAGSDVPSGIDAIHYELSQPGLPGPWFFAEYTGPISVTTLGTYQIRFYSVDNAGNESEIQTAQFVVAAAPQPPAPPTTPAPGTTIPWTGGNYIYILVVAVVCALTGLGLRTRLTRSQ